MAKYLGFSTMEGLTELVVQDPMPHLWFSGFTVFGGLLLFLISRVWTRKREKEKRHTKIEREEGRRTRTVKRKQKNEKQERRKKKKTENKNFF